MSNVRLFKHLTACLGIACILFSLALPADARTRKGDRFFKEAREAETARNYLKAYEFYRQAFEEDPGDARYQLAYERARFRVALEYLKQGQQLREQKQYEEAADLVRKAQEMDPSLDAARRELEEIEELIKKSQSADAGQTDARLQTEDEIAEQRRRALLGNLQAPPDLKPISRKPLNLVINNQPPKVIYETIGKLAGVNVLFDQQFLQQAGNQPRDVQLVNTSLEQALDYVALLTKSFWKPVTDNAIFVTQDDANKRREYADWVVKVFYLRNVNGAQELTEIANNIRQVTNSRFLFPVPTQNALVVRAEKDQVLLIEKLVNDLDKAKPEVVVDVMLFEASRSKTRDLVSSFLSGAANGLSIPIRFTPRAGLQGARTGTDTDNGNTTTNNNTIRLSNIGRLSTNDFSVSLPNAVFSALMTDNNTRVIQSPQLRAIDGVEAKLAVGSQVPIAQGTFASGIGGGVGGLPVAQTQFQFQQVGTEMTMTPRVMGDNEVHLKLMIAIKSVLERIDVGGVQQPVIANREVNHEVRLRAGEVNLIGGLLSQEDTRNLSGTAGLANIPILGRLFSGESVIKRDQDLFIALVPRIIRRFDIDPENTRMVAAGTDQVIKLSYTPPGAKAEAAKPAAAPVPEGASPAAPMVVRPPDAIPSPGTEPANPDPTVPPQPGTREGASGRARAMSRGGSASAGGRTAASARVAGQEVGLPEIARQAGRGIPPASETVPAQMAAAVRFTPPGLVVQSGSTFSLVLDTQGLRDFQSAEFTLEYDPAVLSLKESRQGSLLANSQKRFSIEVNPDASAGTATVKITQAEEGPGVNANGSLAVFQFEALQAGTATVQVPDLAPRNSAGQPLLQTTPVATIRVQ